VGETAAIRFVLSDPATGKPWPGLSKVVNVLSFLAPGRLRTVVPVSELGDGLYEARVALPEAGAYYVHIGAPAMKIGYEVLPFFSLLAAPGPRS
jgi:hypothetical protein